MNRPVRGRSINYFHHFRSFQWENASKTTDDYSRNVGHMKRPVRSWEGMGPDGNIRRCTDRGERDDDALIIWDFLFFFFSSHLFSSHYSHPPSPPVVTQIPGHITGPSPPSPLRYVPSFLNREKNSAFSSLVDSRGFYRRKHVEKKLPGINTTAAALAT